MTEVCKKRLTVYGGREEAAWSRLAEELVEVDLPQW